MGDEHGNDRKPSKAEEAKEKAEEKKQVEPQGHTGDPAEPPD